MVSDIRNIITSSESFKTSSTSASNNSNIEAEKSIERCGVTKTEEHGDRSLHVSLYP